MKKESNYIAPRFLGLFALISLKVRKRIYQRVFSEIKLHKNLNILDIGVTADKSIDSNFFEKYYPFKESITAISLENASFLEKIYPGLKFMRINALKLPFKENHFDIAFCSAVIEHVGSRLNQEKLIDEALRVSKLLILTTPNKYFPIEFHTLTPFIHWLPGKIFRYFLKYTNRGFFAEEKNLNLLSSKDINDILSKKECSCQQSNQKLFGLTSNLVYIIYK